MMNDRSANISDTIDIHTISKAIECLSKADDENLTLVMKHVNDIVTLTRIINIASKQILGSRHD